MIAPVMPNVSIGGFLAHVEFGGLISPGLFQFNVIVPNQVDDGDLMIRAGYGSPIMLTQAQALLSVRR